MKSKILLTGAAGFIGSHLAERLCSLGYTVRALVHYNSRNCWGWLESVKCRDKIEVVTGDIRDFDLVHKAVRGVSSVFHLAALIGIPYSYQSPEAYVETNISGTLNILQAAKDTGVRKVILTSTSEIYGTAQSVPISEKHPINPQSPYAATKAAADLLAMSFYRSFNLPVTIVRPFNTYGPRQSARAVIPTIIIQILKKRGAVRLGALTPTRDLTFVQDTVEGFVRAAESPKAAGEIINLGSGTEISIADLARLIADCLGRSIKIESEEKRQRPEKSEVERLVADNAKAKHILQWAPRYSLREGLDKTIGWFKQNKDIYKAGLYNV
ncbi:MAG: NAD-dependent 4,6-dehydratase LegB [Candidatus Omnitrophota bacterium]